MFPLSPSSSVSVFYLLSQEPYDCSVPSSSLPLPQVTSPWLTQVPLTNLFGSYHLLLRMLRRHIFRGQLVAGSGPMNQISSWSVGMSARAFQHKRSWIGCLVFPPGRQMEGPNARPPSWGHEATGERKERKPMLRVVAPKDQKNLGALDHGGANTFFQKCWGRKVKISLHFK